jgi:hypothetical protein
MNAAAQQHPRTRGGAGMSTAALLAAGPAAERA